MLLFQLSFIAFVGACIHVGLKFKSLQKKSKACGEPFTPLVYLKEDVFAHFVTVMTVVLALFFTYDTIELMNIKEANLPKVMIIIKGVYAFIGYSGSDFSSRVFGAATRRINRVIDEKTHQK